jgi:hypothetical protein
MMETAALKQQVKEQIIHFLKIARSGWRQTVDLLSLEDPMEDVLRRIADKRGVAMISASVGVANTFTQNINDRPLCLNNHCPLHGES